MSLHTSARRAGLLVLVVGLCLGVPACGNKKITRANFDQVKNGMSLAEVEALLGPGTKDEGGDGSGVAAQFGVHMEQAPRSKNIDTYVWESGEKKITVYFAGGKVTNKQQAGL